MASSSSNWGNDRDSAAAPETYSPPPPGEAPRDVADAPPPPEIIAHDPLSQESQWSLVWRQFRKRKLAVLASIVILLLVSSCVFAPFIANDRPIAYHGANRFAYQEAYRNVRVMLRQAPENLERAHALLARAAQQLEAYDPKDDEELAASIESVRTAVQSAIEEQVPASGDIESAASEWHEAILVAKLADRPLEAARSIEDQLQDAAAAAGLYERTIEALPRRFQGMAAGVVAEQAASLGEIDEEFETAIEDDVLTVDEVGSLRQRLQDGHQPDDALFIGRWFFPAIRALDERGIGFLMLNTIVLALIAAKLIWRRPWSKRSRRSAWAGTLLIPAAAALLWWWLVPTEIDATPYKAGAMTAETAGTDVPVMYESVVWPPIRYGFDEANLNKAYEPPEFLGVSEEPRDSEWAGPHWLGTDKVGRDVLSRMLWGGRISLSVGLVAVSIYVSIGIVVGSIAGFFRGWPDMLISRVIEIVIVFPTFFLILTIVAFLDPSLLNIMIVIGLTGWTGVARLVRGEFLRLSNQEFVAAGRALGYSPARLIFLHILPNAMAPVLVAATFGIAGAILTESALSFLGLGITIPTPSWGGILAEGRATKIAPWLIYLPGLAIFVTILCYNLAGEALRDASDPRLRGSR